MDSPETHTRLLESVYEMTT